MTPWNFFSTSWPNFSLPTNIQKRLYKFLLRKAIGQFLAHELDLDNFDIELVNGSVELRDLELNLDTLNECIADTPFVLEEGQVASISASLPWADFWNGDIALKVQGLRLTVRPADQNTRRERPKEEEDTPIMSSSLHFADDFLRTEMEDQELRDTLQQSIHESVAPAPDMDIGDGLQVLTRVIDKMLAKVKVDVIDTLVRVTPQSPGPLRAGDVPDRRHFLDIHIPKIAYFDETPDFNRGQPSTIDPTLLMESSILQPPVTNETIKIITIASPTIWIRSGPNQHPLYSIPTQSETALQNDEDDHDDNTLDALAQTEFYEAEEGQSSYYHTADSIHSSYMSGSTTPRALAHGMNRSVLSGITTNRPSETLLFTTLDKDNWIRIKLRSSSQSMAIAADPSVIQQLDIFFTHMRLIITPWQLEFLSLLLQDIQNGLSPTERSKSESKTTPVGTTTASSASAATPTTATATAMTPTDLMNDLDSFASGQIPYSNTTASTDYATQQPSTSSLPSHRSHGIASPSSTNPIPSKTPSLKIKFQINTFECFILYTDLHSPTPSSLWTDIDGHSFKTMDHLRLRVGPIVAQLQQYPNKDITPDRRPSLRPSHSNPSRAENLHISSMPLSSTLVVRISGLAIDEWVLRPSHSFPPKKQTSKSFQMPYDCYTPILVIHESIAGDYAHDTEFPVLPMPPSYTTQQAQGQGHGSSTNRTGIIRIRIERRHKQQVNHFVNALSFDEDLNVEIPPFAIHVDPRIADRLENYVYVILRANQKHGQTKDMETPGSLGNSFGQRIYEDLDRASLQYQCRKKMRVRFAFIRILLQVPDMGQVSTRNEFNDQLHEDMLSVDIKQGVATWSSDGAGEKKTDAASRLPLDLGPRSSTAKPTVIQMECNFVNVFLKQAEDQFGRCWFTAKTVLPASRGIERSLSGSVSPSFEITLCSPGAATPVSPARPGYFGAGSDIPSNLFAHLGKNEEFNADQKLHMPMEDQAESAMIFKQRTVETSLVVVNCHFPHTRLSLSKRVWGTVQILQNDLILWQPRFLSQLPADNADATGRAASPMSSMSESATTGTFHDTRSYFSDNEFHRDSAMRASSILSQSTERLGEGLQVSSMLALVAVMSDAVWDLCIQDDNDQVSSVYRLRMSEFRYFTVVKHLGMNENITTLDIDELWLTKIQPVEVPIIYRTIPRTWTLKRNTAMISLFSRLTFHPELNKQSKITSIVVCNLCWRLTMDLSFIEELLEFQKVPEEMVYIDPPTQYNKIYAHVLEASLDYKPIQLPSRSVIVVDNLQAITELISSGQPLIDVKLYLQKAKVFLLEDASSLEKRDSGLDQAQFKTMDAFRYWSSLGFPCILSTRHLDIRAKLKVDEESPGPQVDLAVLNNIVTLECCADSVQALANIINYVINVENPVVKEKQERPKDVKQPRDKGKGTSQSQWPVMTARPGSDSPIATNGQDNMEEPDDDGFNKDMLASLDPEAFRRWASATTDSVSRDADRVPRRRSQGPPKDTGLSYVEGYYSQASAANSSARASNYKPLKPRRKNAQAKALREDKIRVLVDDTQELTIVEDFYHVDKPTAAAEKSPVDVSRSMISVRVRDFDITIKLFEGYDCSYILPERIKESSRSDMPHAQPAPSPSMPSHAFSETMSRNNSTETATMGTPVSVGTNSPTDRHTLSSVSSSPFSVSFDRPDSPVIDIVNKSVSGATSESLDKRRRRSTLSRPTDRVAQRDRRMRSPDIEIRIDGLKVDFHLLPTTDQTALHLLLQVRDFEIIDNIKTSTWKKFMGYMRPDASEEPRERGSMMVHFEVMGIRPIPQDPTLEYRVKLRLLPLRLYVDQDALNFLVKFFTFDRSLLKSSTALHNVMLAEGLYPPDTEAAANDQELFFQYVDIAPITVKIDYKPKHINYMNIKEGQFAELVNLFHLDGADVQLSHVKIMGVNGIARLVEKLGQEWLPHVKNTQVPHMISGVSPIRSIVNVGTGVADLVLLPIQQYRKDGRIILGIQKGTQSLAKATALEAIKLSARFASGAQVILEQADEFFSARNQDNQEEDMYFTLPENSFYAEQGSSGASTPHEEVQDEDGYFYADAHIANAAAQDYLAYQAMRRQNSGAVSKFANQPSDVSQGFHYAYQSLSRNFESAAHTIFAIPTEIRDPMSAGDSSLPPTAQAKAVIKAVPVAVIKPMIGLTGAFHSILMGLRNTIDPSVRLQNEDKYKQRQP